MRKGISPLISFVIAVLLITVATTLALNVIAPTFNRVSDSNTINEGMQNLELINSAIKEVASQSEGSKKTISISVSNGEYIVNTTEDYIYFDYDTKSDYVIESPFPYRNVRLDRSPVFMDYFGQYVENSNASPPWTIKNGTWSVDSGEYSGQNGLAYYHYGNIGEFAFQGWITNKTGTKAEIFVLPVSPTNLVGYWTFDENSGTNVWDYSGFNNTGIVTNGTTICSGGDCPYWTSGKFDYSLSFDGTDDYVNISLTSMGKTVALWKKNSTDTDWYHLVNSSGVSYVNGVAGANQEIPVTNFTGRVIIGKDSSGNYFNGAIDEVMIFDISLTAAQVKSLYETSWKKLSSTGKSDTISATTDAYLVLSTPNGHTHFDEVKIKTNKRMMKLSIPYSNIDLNGTARLGKGNYQLVIKHMGVNSTLSKPIVELTIA